MVHYDIRVLCPISGALEATEDIGHDIASLDHAMEILSGTDTTYVAVRCERPGSDPIHDVDIAVHRHHTICLGEYPRQFERWVGAPTDALIAPRS